MRRQSHNATTVAAAEAPGRDVCWAATVGVARWDRRAVPVLLYLLLLVPVTALQAERPRTVLLLHSTHRSMPWSERVTEGVEAVLQRDPFAAELRVEYMDGLRHHDPEYMRQLTRFYARKYPGQVDVLMPVGDAALSFALQHRGDLFPAIPIVFCGVNDYRQAVRSSVENIAGVLESWDVRRTVQAARRLHPGTHRVIVVHDATPDGQAAGRRIAAAADELDDGLQFEFVGEGMTLAELTERLRAAPEDAVVLVARYNRDAENRVFDNGRALAQIVGATQQPVYGLYRHQVGHGVVGGYVADGGDDGFLAGRLALHILRGAFPALISVVSETSEQFVCDYRQLEAFGIAMKDLPADSIVINRPLSFLEQYRSTVAAVLASLVVAVLLLVLFVHSRTARRSAEGKLRTYQQQLQELVQRRTLSLTTANRKLAEEIQRRRAAEERLETTLNDLRETNADLERFAYIASHDLREPLRTITGFSNLLQRRYGSELDQDAKEFIELMVDAAKRAEVLIGDLLQYSRVGTAGKPFEPTDCNAVLDDVLANLHFIIESETVAIERATLPVVMGDASQLSRVFQNLIENAIKFRAKDRPVRIEVDACEEDGMWHFAVRDNGIGIEPDELDHVFELFRRVHGRKYPGTGMGLAICKRIIERHGGTIWAESQVGKGTAFHFTLPNIDDADEHLATPEEREQAGSGGGK